MIARKRILFLTVIVFLIKTESAFVSNQIGKQCSDDLELFEANLKNLTTWAAEIWESTGKPLAILKGNHYQLGDYDECVQSSEGFERQYCLAKLNLDTKYPKKVHNNIADVLLDRGNTIRLKRNQMFWGWCGPASCSRKDVKIILSDYPFFSHLFKPANITYEIILNENSCQTDQSDSSYTIGSIIFICCFSLLLMCTLFSTMILWYFEQGDAYTCPDFIKSFSIIENVQQLFAKEEPCLKMTYGLRTIAAAYIICMHYFGTILIGPIQNRNQTEMLHGTWYGAFVVQFLAAFVDVFFVLGGFFAVYSLSKRIHKKSLLGMIATRLVRILPLYVFIIFFIVTILPQTGSGPMWGMMMTEIEYCRRNWWTNLLFVNNYVNTAEPCMGNTWYIACDFHFYLIALALCHFLANPKKEKTGLKIIGFLLILSILIPTLITYFMELSPSLYFTNLMTVLPRVHKTLQYMYMPSHNRMAPALLGMLAAYLFMKWKDTEKSKISGVKSTVIFQTALLVFIANTLFLCLVFDPEPPHNPLAAGLYAGLHRPINGLCACTMILICVFGYVPWVDHLLSSTPMIVLGKLTYGAYMISLTIQLRGEGKIRQSVYFDYGGTFMTAIGYLINSFLLSLLGYLLIEAPTSGLFKLLMIKKESSSK